MTILVVLFAEILPKTYALQNTDRVALKVAPFIRPIIFLFSPFTRATSFITRITFLVFGIKLHNKNGFVSRTEELRGAIELHKGEHETVKRERAMLRSVLDLAEVEVGAIMIHRKTVTMINADDPSEDIVSQVLACPYTRLPLWREDPDNIIGILHAKELLRALQEKPGETTELNIPNLSSDPWFIPETTHLLDQLQAFRERHEHFALVVDEYGSLMGVVTLEDILEEIVGDISDEHDISASGLRRQADGTFIVEGKFTIRDLNRQLDWNLPDEEAATVAGLILHESRRIPEVGQTFLFYGVRFEVLRRQRNQITAVRVAQQKN
jgi:Mg2+/Co2+ transporter CorB